MRRSFPSALIAGLLVGLLAAGQSVQPCFAMKILPRKKSATNEKSPFRWHRLTHAALGTGTILSLFSWLKVAGAQASNMSTSADTHFLLPMGSGLGSVKPMVVDDTSRAVTEEVIRNAHGLTGVKDVDLLGMLSRLDPIGTLSQLASLFPKDIDPLAVMSQFANSFPSAHNIDLNSTWEAPLIIGGASLAVWRLNHYLSKRRGQKTPIQP